MPDVMRTDHWRVKPGKKVRLKTMATELEGGLSDSEAKKKLKDTIDAIAQLQNRLYAENRQSLLILFQGMDSSGKDSAIKKIMRGVNPQGITVTSFKHPSVQELDHSYLWRHVLKLPGRGEIAVFNRSHYENVLISRVHPELVLAERLPGIERISDVDAAFWELRFKQIRELEHQCFVDGTQILKFFLHISMEEQRKRFLERIENREKHWKFTASDIAERQFRAEYETAYEEAFHATSTKELPWYIIPADNKSLAHLLIAEIILEKLREMDPQFPEVSKEEQELMEQARKQLEEEG